MAWGCLTGCTLETSPEACQGGTGWNWSLGLQAVGAIPKPVSGVWGRRLYLMANRGSTQAHGGKAKDWSNRRGR